MDNKTYPWFLLKMHRSYLLFSVIVMALIQYMMVELMTMLNIDEFYESIFAQMPDPKRF